MTTGAVILIVVAVVATAVTVGWFLFTRKHPESMASRRQRAAVDAPPHHENVMERPAGPGAEADGVAGPGQPVPGPSTGSPGPALGARDER
jgi:hypothetical protein